MRGRVVYKGQTYAQTCGHHLTGSQHTRRGLCPRCAEWARTHGYLDQHERQRNDSSHVLEEIFHGTIQGWNDSRLVGLTPASLERMLYRADRPDLARKFRPPKNRR